MADFVYTLILGVVIGIFLTLIVLWTDLSYRGRKLRRRNEERTAYQLFVSGADLPSNKSAEASGR